MTMEGGCFCGAVRYRIEGTPSRVTNCHCIHCRRTSGAPFLTWAEAKASAFKFTKGIPNSFESRPHVTRKFCANCGTQLTFQNAEDDDLVDITVGSLDTPASVTPEDHVWCDRMLPWIKLQDGLPHYGLARDWNE